MSEAPRRSASQSVLTSQREEGLSCGMRIVQTETCAVHLLAATLCKRNPHPSVLLALLFDLRDAYVADLVRPMHVGAAAGLQIVSDDLDEPDAARADGRLDRHGLDQAGRGFEFRVRDPARAHLGAGRDHRGEFSGDLVLVEPSL